MPLALGALYFWRGKRALDRPEPKARKEVEDSWAH